MVLAPRCPPGARGLLALLLLLLPPPLPGARAESCGHPGDLVNGKVHITDLLFGSEITFSCDEGFRLIGPKTSKCAIAGTRVTWDHEIPFCEEIPCLPPPEIKNGRYSGDPNNHYTYGSTVTYSCDTGGTDSFSLIGKASIYCTSDKEQNGVWSGAAPECKVGCLKPEVQNGSMVNALDEKMWYRVNETIPFKCSPGYQFSSHSHQPATDIFSITCLVDGSWTALPKCKKQSTSDVCEMVPESREFTECGVPLETVRTLLEVQKLYLEIEKLKQELKSQ
ncbi:C4b-binding protein alpha chain-like [Macrochelys suwanniensis]